MKRALIAIASVGILAATVGVEAANAQMYSPTPAPAYTPPAYTPQSRGWEWYASVGPVRRGNQCVADVDINRGYGFLKDCPAPQASAAPRTSRVAHHRRNAVTR
jgi:hypothetical protein